MLPEGRLKLTSKATGILDANFILRLQKITAVASEKTKQTMKKMNVLLRKASLY